MGRFSMPRDVRLYAMRSATHEIPRSMHKEASKRNADSSCHCQPAVAWSTLTLTSEMRAWTAMFTLADQFRSGSAYCFVKESVSTKSYNGYHHWCAVMQSKHDQKMSQLSLFVPWSSNTILH